MNVLGCLSTLVGDKPLPFQKRPSTFDFRPFLALPPKQQIEQRGGAEPENDEGAREERAGVYLAAPQAKPALEARMVLAGQRCHLMPRPAEQPVANRKAQQAGAEDQFVDALLIHTAMP